MCESLFEFYKTAIRRAQQDPDAAMESLRKAEPPPQKSLIATFKEMRAAQPGATASPQSNTSIPASEASHSGLSRAQGATYNQTENGKLKTCLPRRPANEEERAALRQSLAALNPFAV